MLPKRWIALYNQNLTLKSIYSLSSITCWCTAYMWCLKYFEKNFLLHILQCFRLWLLLSWIFRSFLLHKTFPHLLHSSSFCHVDLQTPVSFKHFATKFASLQMSPLVMSCKIQIRTEANFANLTIFPPRSIFIVSAICVSFHVGSVLKWSCTMITSVLGMAGLHVNLQLIQSADHIQTALECMRYFSVTNQIWFLCKRWRTAITFIFMAVLWMK